MDVERLNKAFQNFTIASKSLETSYDLLREKIRYLTTELEIKNKQLNDALADAEKNREYLKAILYNLEEAIIVTDPEDMVTMINRSAEKLLELSPVDAIGREFRHLPFSVTENGSETFLHVDGKEYNIILSKSHVTHTDGYLKGRVVLIKDITRLKELEVQQKRNQRLIAMGEMSAKIVHEIRNPLCSIELFASMLEKDIVDPAHRELARGISIGISNLNNILKNMLFFARPHKPLMKRINLLGVIKDSIPMFKLLMESRKIRLKQLVFDYEILGDAELLKQVFINIIINAIQSMHEVGRIDITMRTDEKGIIVDLRDSGDGIKQEYIEKIFNPFFSTKDTGTGLGLAIAAMIMQGHGGYIKVKSEVGKGSTFSLFFHQKEDA
jgi:signal transduction histidine kinase